MTRLNVFVGETGVSWDTFHFFSNIAENIYNRDFDLTRQGRGILPLQTGLISYVVTSFVETEYGVNETYSNCPNLARHGIRRDSGIEGVRVRVHLREWTGIRRPTMRKLYTNA